jgi:hypothetical protein
MFYFNKKMTKGIERLSFDPFCQQSEAQTNVCAFNVLLNVF